MHFNILVVFAFILHIYLHLCKATNLYRFFTIIFYRSKATFTIGYQEETKLFTQELPTYFPNEECLLIKELFKRYMDDRFIFWPKHFDFNSFSIFLSNLHPAIKYTFIKAKIIVQNSESCQVINVLDI